MAFLGLLACGLYACSKSASENAAKMPPNKSNMQANLEGWVVKGSAISEKITVSGSLLPSEETALHPEVSGRVVTLHLPEGELVEKGKLLVKIFDGDLQAQLQKLQAQLQIAENTEKRQKELLAVNGISQQDYDLSVLQISNIKADMRLVRTQIGKTEIRAPYAGTIGLRNISMGAYISPADVVATIRQNKQLKLDFSIPEKYSHLLKTGQKIQFRPYSIPDTLEAQIIASEKSVDTDTRNLNIRAKVLKSDSRLLPGTFAEINLVVNNNSNALLIPSQAIIPQARDKKVIVVRNGIANFQVIKTGIRKEKMVEVTEGLSAGDTIAVTGVLFVKPEMQLKFSKIKNL